MKKILSILISILFFGTHCFSDNHKTNFKDIKGYKKQFISMSEKKVNRIKEVKASEGFPVYEIVSESWKKNIEYVSFIKI